MLVVPGRRRSPDVVPGPDPGPHSHGPLVAAGDGCLRIAKHQGSCRAAMPLGPGIKSRDDTVMWRCFAKTNPRPSNLVLSFSRLPATSVVATNGQREGGWQEIGRVSGSKTDQPTREVGRKSAKRFSGSTTDQLKRDVRVRRGSPRRRPKPSGSRTARQPNERWTNGCGRTPERERGLAPALRGGLSPKTGRRGA